MSNLPKAAWQDRLRAMESDGWQLEKAPVGQYARLSRDGEVVMLEPDGNVRPIAPEPSPPQQAVLDEPEIVSAVAVIDEQRAPARSSFSAEEILGVPKELVVSLNGKLFVTQAGLLLKCERKGGYRSMHAEIVGEVKEGDKVIGYEAVGYIYPNLSAADLKMLELLPQYPEKLQARLMDEIGRPYTATATATKANVKMSAMHHYLKELACTRALNRALRLYTSCGFTSTEEMDDHEEVD